MIDIRADNRNQKGSPVKFTSLTAIASVFTLATVGVLGGPGVAGATTPTSATEDSGTPEGIDLSEIPEEGAEALSCYAGGHGWTKAENSMYVPRAYPEGDWFTTRDNCNDINVIVDSDGPLEIEVCFNPSWGEPFCQGDTTTVGEDSWSVVAANVGPSTLYKLRIHSDPAASGRVAS
ncbi:hypothetical protein [Nocardiopsis oceani]